MPSISLNSLSLRDSFECWHEVLNQRVAPMRYERVGDEPALGEMSAKMIGDAPLMELLCGGARASRTRSEIARSSDHFYALVVQTDGTTCITVRGEDVPLRRGDIFLGDTMHELALDLERPCQHLIVKLPPPWIEARVARPDLFFGTILRDRPVSRLLASYLVNGFQMADELSPAVAEMFAQHTVDLLTQALVETQSDPTTPSDAWRAAIFLRARRLIMLNLGDSNLSPDRIAAQLHVSKRTLERIFAAHDDTVMRRVYEERVRQAARLLATPAAAHRSVTEIAFACGFQDSAHFTRTFAARNGITPSKWRKQGVSS